MIRYIEAGSYAELSRLAADIIVKAIAEKAGRKRKFVLGLATGSSPLGTYKELIRRNKAGEVDFSGVATVNLDEYVGLGPDHPQGYRYYMDRNLFRRINIDRADTFVPDGLAADLDAECRAYDERIEKLGGIDLQLLGIGNDGHIGFNEPASCFVVPTHVTGLTDSTIFANSRFFSSADEVPRKAITMGIGPIMAARRIVLVANGGAKKEILRRAVEGSVDPLIQASVLQLHRDVTVIFSEK